MKKMKLNTLLVACIGLASGLTATASAGPVPGDTIYLEYKTSGPSRPIHYSYIYGERATSVNRPGGSFGYAGFLNWYGGIRTFCVQIKEGIQPDVVIPYTFAEVQNTPEGVSDPGPMGIMRETMIRDLYSRWWAPVNSSTSFSTSSRDICAAFQAMIWEITHETLDSTGTMDPGSVQVDALALDFGAMQINSMTSGATDFFYQMKMSLGGSNNDEWLNYLGDSLWGLTNPVHQDQLIVVPGASAGFMGLAAFAARRRRRR